MTGLLARLIVGALFVLAAIGKIAEPAKFVEEIRKYDLVPFQATRPMAYVLPWMELLAAAFLVLGLWRREVRGILLLLLAVFTSAKVIVYAMGRQIECGCGGGFEFLKPIFDNPQGIATNLFLIALLVVDGVVSRRRVAAKASQDAQSPDAPPGAPVTSA